MIKIRRGTFETNSSSMHSLVITKNKNVTTLEKLEEDIYIPNNGKLSIYDSDELYYDRAPFRMLMTPFDKLKYLVASNENDKKKVKKLIDTFKKLYPKVKDISFPDDDYESGTFYGKVDHQSRGFIDNFLKENMITEEEFLSEDKYIIIIDGDEYCEWEKIKKSGLIDTENIILDISAFDCDLDFDMDEDLEER